MSNISLKIGVATDRATTLAAINTIEGLSSWWTTDVSGETSEGQTIRFRFNESGPDMKVTASSNDKVVWLCTAGPDEWLGTEISFLIKDEDETVIYFQHKNWREETPFHYHCSMKWATFLLSLKELLDEGKGRPFPDDRKIVTTGF
ncbi:SRPBCC domain-containing protein [Aliikangiella coralliicola]|uniref:SRPBCC domain-containing protein n=1 Tax=Aliikangiella coralliicola TaxID=2592383 RepID=A0A545UC65_9GAMM|nr:SRPBCC domain-containing protein [Aliikangiella coralliicola]TQV87054.1 SRPBCC domain-containing protein [Aliikangiella coralliicola]